MVEAIQPSPSLSLPTSQPSLPLFTLTHGCSEGLHGAFGSNDRVERKLQELNHSSSTFKTDIEAIRPISPATSTSTSTIWVKAATAAHRTSMARGEMGEEGEGVEEGSGVNPALESGGVPFA